MRLLRLLTATALAVGVAAPGIAPSATAAQDDYRTTKGKTQPIYTESVTEEYRIPTKYGTIYGVVVRPVVPAGKKVPVILTYSPYNVLTRPIGAVPQANLGDPVQDYFVPRGYARALFDLVGTRESSGCYDHGGVRERVTGAAVVEYLAKQPWSSGKVGMIGASYDGTTQWATAVEAPPHLTTIVPQVAIGRWYDYAYGQGIRFQSGSGTPVAFDYGFGFLPPTSVTGGTAWAQAVQDHLNPCERALHNQRAFLPDPVYDSYWDERDYLARISKVKASVLLVGSWQDTNVHPVNAYEMWRALPAGLPKKLIMGPNGHSDAQVKDNQDLYHAWFDHWLLGLDTGIMRLPRSDSVVNSKERFQDSAWPPVGTKNVTVRLGRGSARGTLGLVDSEVARWTDDNPGLSEQSALAANAQTSRVLFTGGRVAADVRISGVPLLQVSVTTSAESTHLTPVLFDESSTGARTVITRGLLNSRNRSSLRESKPLAPGSTWRAEVRFQPVDWVLLEGHRLGMAMMSMNTDEALYPDTTGATNELRLDRTARLLVPVSRNARELAS
ncbi:MAG: X-Pro dipeptidyl-peptidase [Actinomycetota bacterium]|jgi:X-Pro dipeptidyl-peptidase|nr:X-Pro dipeptidyl-peptidase [Actinomycetota bacterium]